MTVSGDREQVHAVINVTPMIDVLLVVLIIFMAIAPVRSSGLNALIPRLARDFNPRVTEDPVVLTIANDGTFRLNAELVSSIDLHHRVMDLFQRRAERVLFVKASSSLEFGVVASAIDVARGANVDSVPLMPR